MKFKVDQTVIVSSLVPGPRGIALKGKTGRIVHVCNDDTVGVEFDENIKGHNCDGTAKDGHGWNIEVRFLREHEKIKFIKGMIFECREGYSKGKTAKALRIGKWDGQGNKDSVWGDWNKDGRMTYLNKQDLKSVK